MSACPPPRAFRRARLVRNETLAEGIFELEFDWTGPAPASGQFFLLRPVRGSVLLGRAISVYGWAGTPSPGDRASEESADSSRDRASLESAAGRLRFLIAERGIGTRELRDLRVGETAELVGPLGNSWKSASHRLGGRGAARRPIALVGGGIGLAPLIHFASELSADSFDLYAGFRSRPYGLRDVRPRKLIIATEDGYEGHEGRITEVIDWSAYGSVYACGPEPMLRAVAAACKTTGVPALLSLERRMACGVGACLGCTVRTTRGNRRCCADGPIFTGEEIVFDD